MSDMRYREVGHDVVYYVRETTLECFSSISISYLKKHASNDDNQSIETKSVSNIDETLLE